MLARIREREGGYVVTLYDAAGEQGSRETCSLVEAFEWQLAGQFPVTPRPEPEARKGNRK